MSKHTIPMFLALSEMVSPFNYKPKKQYFKKCKCGAEFNHRGYMCKKCFDGLNLLIKNGNAYAQDIELHETVEGQMVKPTLTISRKQGQVLMDDLWHAGFRPTEGSGSAGSLAATERHLKDMRKIAFNKLKISGESKIDSLLRV